MVVVSLDLAARRAADNGLAVLRERGAAVECFPTAGWRALGLRPLPAKSCVGAAELDGWLGGLREGVPLRVRGRPGHDELQAVVGGLAGLALARGACEGFALQGDAPFVRGGHWREGFILCPARADASLG